MEAYRAYGSTWAHLVAFGRLRTTPGSIIILQFQFSLETISQSVADGSGCHVLYVLFASVVVYSPKDHTWIHTHFTLSVEYRL